MKDEVAGFKAAHGVVGQGLKPEILPTKHFARLLGMLVVGLH